MSCMEFRAHYDGKTFVPDEPVDIAPGTEVEVKPRTQDLQQGSDGWWRAFRDFVGKGPRGAVVNFDRGDIYP